MKSNETAKKSNAERQSCYRADKLFRSLPLDVQHSIEYMSQSRAEAGFNSYENEKSARTERAIKYQRMFPSNIHRGVPYEVVK